MSDSRPALRNAVALLVLAGAACTATQPAPPELTSAVATASGPVQGLAADDHSVKRWLGIPYAAPPVGSLRWAPPQPAEIWQEPLRAQEFGPGCQQTAGPEGGFYTSELPALSEDCLTLNVFSAATTADEARPVMFWIHGGGLVNGSSHDYDGSFLARKGVVVVTINYRLGPFGFFAHEALGAEDTDGVSGNQGLRDQIAALRWTRDNIASFGGDPDNVTIFGESAGALSVSLVQASPLAKGLFHRAIGQSGGSFQPMTFLDRAVSYSPSAEELGAEMAQAIVGAEEDASLESLRTASVEQVLTAFAARNVYDRLAIVDGVAIPREVSEIFADGEQADVPVMLGSNKDEGSAFVPYFAPLFGDGVAGLQAYLGATLPEVAADAVALYSADDDEQARTQMGHAMADVLFTYPQRAWVRGMASVASPAYLYWFTWEPPIPLEGLGAFHAAEISYVFGDPSGFDASPTEADRAFSEELSDLWVRFATTGDPNGDGFATWPAYSAENEAYMELGPAIAAGEQLRTNEIELIDRAFALRRAR